MCSPCNFFFLDAEIRSHRVPFLVPRANFVSPQTLLDEEAMAAAGAQRDVPAIGGHSVQIVRSLSRWSGGTFTESSLAKAHIGLIESAKHFVYIENQFFMTSCTEDSTGVLKEFHPCRRIH